MLVRLEQRQNAYSPIEITPSGITTLRILVQPQNKYGLTDVISEGIEEIDAKNVKSILFNAQESAYLAGLVAGKMTKTNSVGFIGGMELPVIDTFKYGFMAGVKAATPNAEV